MNDRHPEGIEQAATWLREAKRIVVFTGAGVSAESGIPTFRDESGFWNEFPPESFATWTGIVQNVILNPKLLSKFLIALLEPIANAKPNAAHRAIARLEQHASVTVVTQNVDGLHQEAGSQTVWEIHGTLLETVTGSRDVVQQLTREDLRQLVEKVRGVKTSRLAAFELAAALKPYVCFSMSEIRRPNVVLFGDAMAEPAWTNATAAVNKCDLMLCVGTSGLVYPAASLPRAARDRGINVVSIDPLVSGGNLWLKGTAGDVMPALVEMTFG